MGNVAARWCSVGTSGITGSDGLSVRPSVLVGKRRIRVHTLCLPVVSQLSDVYAGADVQAITCLLADMGESAALSPLLVSSQMCEGDARAAISGLLYVRWYPPKGTGFSFARSGILY